MIRIQVTSLLPLVAALGLTAEQPKRAEDDLLDLLNTPVTVASRKPMTTREAPGIVSLVTREEILASGARDLLDVLRLVPGFDFASDVQGVVGPAVRGLWGFEGKVLLLVDGQELNELRYGTVAFGNHVPVDQIRQVEVIRGPGSAVYGGFAELAVVNVVTRSGAELRGGSGGLHLGATPGGATVRGGNAAYGVQQGELSYSVSLSAGEGRRSEERWNAFGQERDLKASSRLGMGFFNVGLEYGDFSLRLIQDQYTLEEFTFFKPFSPSPMRFSGTYAEAKYSWELNSRFKLIPRLSYKIQQPWFYPDEPGGRKREVSRSLAGLLALWDFNPALSLSLGGETWRDEGRASGKGPLWSNGRNTISYQSEALFGQLLLSVPLGNFTLGGRYDHNSQFGSSFVPRLAFTRTWDDFHLKLLASKAFRAPSMENYEFNPEVRPERTTALEMELGARFGSSFLSINLFQMSIKDMMVYYYNGETGFESYKNYPNMGSRGFEVEFLHRGEWGFLKAGLTVAKAQDSQVPDYTVPGDDGAFVGLPNVKATLLASLRLPGNWSFAPSLVALGPRHTFESSGGPVHREAVTLVNLMVHHRLGAHPWLLTLGAHNLTGANVGFPKAYRSTDGDTYPSQPQDFYLRLAYNF